MSVLPRHLALVALDPTDGGPIRDWAGAGQRPTFLRLPSEAAPAIRERSRGLPVGAVEPRPATPASYAPHARDRFCQLAPGTHAAQILARYGADPVVSAAARAGSRGGQ